MSTHRLQVPKVLNQDTGGELLRAAQKLHIAAEDELLFDLSTTHTMDSPGGGRLIEIADVVHACGGVLRIEGQQGSVAGFIDILQPALRNPQSGRPRRSGPLNTLTDKTYIFGRELRAFVELCVDALYWTLLAPLEGRGFRWNLFIDEIHEMGVRAIRIVCLMNFLLGLIIAMLSSAQVASFGLSIYVADLIMIGFARELAAIMTATVVSARTGAAIAAELATMKVQEEIDALRGMGLNVVQFLVAPRLAAMIIVLPCLVALGLISGLLGGTAWGVIVLGFYPQAWLTETINATYMRDFIQGFLKTGVFAVMIALIGCHNGLRVEGGSRGVGLMTTRAVVMDIFMIISIDIVFAAIFYYALA